ncbi:MAG: metal-dependent hydrolase [Haloquadratum sp.]
MFVGHATLAFALAVAVAERRGWSTTDALAVGVVAGAFATLPDVDVVYAVATVDVARFLGGGTVHPSAFWAATRDVHRSITHSVLVALVAGPAFGLWAAAGDRTRPSGTPVIGAVRRLGEAPGSLAALCLAGLLAVAVAASGSVGGVVMGAFVLGGAGLAELGRRRTRLSARSLAIAATGGLLSHPWGDLVTGTPPQLLYPVDVGILDARIALHSDPTIHLLGAFALELAAVWLGVLAVVSVMDRSLGAFYDRSAGVGAAYGAAPFVLVPPTLEVAYHFVFSILAVGGACAVLAWYRSPTAARPANGRDGGLRDGISTVVIGLLGVTVALVGYATVYLLQTLL